MMNVELSNVELPISSFASKYFLKHITPLSFGEGLGGEATEATQSLPSYVFAVKVASEGAA